MNDPLEDEGKSPATAHIREWPIPTIRPGFRAVQIFARALITSLFNLKVIGRENVPKSGPFIFASVHKSWFDPPIIGSTSPREIHFAAKKELFNMPIVGPLIKYLNSIPVKRSGFDREALVRLIEVLRNGGGIIIFPEGTRYLDDKLHQPKSGVGMLALKYDTPIVPVFITGSAQIRRQLFRRKLTIKYGPPFRISEAGITSTGRDAYADAADYVMERIAFLGNVPPPEKTGQKS